MSDDEPLSEVAEQLEARIHHCLDKTKEREPRVLQAVSRLAEAAQTARYRVEKGKSVESEFLRQAFRELRTEVNQLAEILQNYEVDRTSYESVTGFEHPPYARDSDSQN